MKRDMGTNGSDTWSAPVIPGGEAFIWWTIGGTDGDSTESSRGKGSSGWERNLNKRGASPSLVGLWQRNPIWVTLISFKRGDVPVVCLEKHSSFESAAQIAKLDSGLSGIGIQGDACHEN